MEVKQVKVKDASDNYPSGSLVIYVGGMSYGWAKPVKSFTEDIYTFRSAHEVINSVSEPSSIEEIKDGIILDIKEFCAKVLIKPW